MPSRVAKYGDFSIHRILWSTADSSARVILLRALYAVILRRCFGRDIAAPQVAVDKLA